MKRIDRFVVPMFPYPSGSGLHMGHYYNYAILDSYCNHLRYNGYEVFQPFGYDAFGLPAENYAKKVGRDPKEVTYENIENFRTQMKRMGTKYEEMLVTCSDDYIRATQNLFMTLYNRGLAYKKDGDVDYCPSCETTLAREQVKEGKCERCGTASETKTLNQWYFRITDYKDRLIAGLDNIDYPESTKKAQRHWLENLHDWCISRQRSWGCPIPLKGETDTLDTFVDSSFYTIVYCLYKDIIPRPVDVYVGGNEHACMHLIYARFITMVLFDEGLIDFEEPFNRVIHQGMILKDNGDGSKPEKMSKSKGNVVSPDDYDPAVLRFYLMFIGHYFDGGVFDDKNISGIKRFFGRWHTLMEKNGTDTADIEVLTKTLFDYTEAFKFNKVVSSFMEFYNKNKGKSFDQPTKVALNKLLLIYAPTLELQTEEKCVPINIWDDFWDDGNIPEGEIQETRLYIESSDYSSDEMDNIMEMLVVELGKLDLTGVEYHYDGVDIWFRHLTHERLEVLVEELDNLKLSLNGIPFSIYSES